MLTLNTFASWGSWTDTSSSPSAITYMGGGTFVTGNRNTTSLATNDMSGTTVSSSGTLSGFIYTSDLGVHEVTVGGADYIITTGHYFQDGISYAKTGTGLGNPSRIMGSDGLVMSLDSATIGTDTVIYTVGRKGEGVSVWRGDMVNGWTKSQEYKTADWTQTGGLSTITRVDDQLYVASSHKNSVTSVKINADGSLSECATIDATHGLMVTTPSCMVNTSVGGQDFLIVGATSSSSISVIKLTGEGRMQVSDLVLDTTNTRFGNITNLHTFTAGEKTYVVASGNDKGLSIMTLLPNGQLIHTATIADTTGITLDSVNAIETVVGTGTVDMYVSSDTEAGATKISFSADTTGRVINATASTTNGTAGADILNGAWYGETLVGNGGDDILIDGGGSDIMYGGTGADIFVFTADNEVDTVMDFDPTQDKLDLSSFHGANTKADLTFVSTSTGVEITYGDEKIIVHSANGTSLNATHFTEDMLFSMDRVDIANTPEVAPAGLEGRPKVPLQGPIDPPPPPPPPPPPGASDAKSVLYCPRITDEEVARIASSTSQSATQNAAVATSDTTPSTMADQFVFTSAPPAGGSSNDSADMLRHSLAGSTAPETPVDGTPRFFGAYTYDRFDDADPQDAPIHHMPSDTFVL